MFGAARLRIRRWGEAEQAHGGRPVGVILVFLWHRRQRPHCRRTHFDPRSALRAWDRVVWRGSALGTCRRQMSDTVRQEFALASQGRTHTNVTSASLPPITCPAHLSAEGTRESGETPQLLERHEQQKGT